MSTQQILGVVGGVVGAFFGYPQLGFVVGSLVGGLLTPGEKTQGPRVDDLKVQVSTYGAGIPRLNGTERLGGNVVWSTDKIETEETTGGKGGAPENTTYRYFVHMGIVLCETPRDGSEVSIVQIYQDGKLIYDVRSGRSVGSALASAENPYAFFVLYQGHADQLPDPIEELHEGGPGTVPAYRGVVRIRMNAIECPGGRVPQFSFVMSTNASVTQQKSVFFAANDGGYGAAIINAQSIWHVHKSAASKITVKYGDQYGATVTSIIDTSGSVGPTFQPVIVAGALEPVVLLSSNHFVDSQWHTEIKIINLESNNIADATDGYMFGTPSTGPGIESTSRAAFDAATSQYLISDGQSSDLYIFLLGGTPTRIPSIQPSGAASPLLISNGVVYLLLVNGSGLDLVAYEIASLTEIARVAAPANQDAVGYDSGVPKRCMMSWGEIAPNGAEFDIYVWVGTTGNTARLYRVTQAGWTLLSADAETLVAPRAETVGGTFYTNGRVAIMGPSSDASRTYTFLNMEVIETESVRVKDIIEDLCDRADETRIDLTGIPDADVLHGYKLQNPASARSDIDPLLTAFAIYIVDEDGVIKFKKYEDIASEANIAYDELGQAEDGAEPADAMPLNRAQEIDLPRSVSVSYIDPTFDYQTATEKEVRQITEATEDMVIEMPMATNSDHAKKLASMVLFAKWRSQNTRSFKTSRKYSFLSPGDGVTVEYPRGTFRLWRITSMTDTGVLCEFNVEPGDSELYTQTAVGATGYVGQEVAPLAPPTRIVIGDWALLRDADNSAGPYVAMEGYSPTGWTGAELLIGDDDTNLQSRGSVTNPAVIGFAETTLGSWDLGVVDETNIVTVNIGADELSSITREVLLAGTANVFALGLKGRWEIAQFQRADDLGSGRYILSGLRRGLRATEYAAGLHADGDTFVLLSTAGMLKPGMEVGAIGQTRSYRAVSKGRSSSSVASTLYAGTGEPLKPFGPVDLRKSFSGNDIVFTWHRRTRMSENVLTGIFPLGEASERYVLELCTDSTFASVLRTFSVTSETATYTEAMQDFDGYVSGPLYARVAQISDAVGRGHELEETL